MKETDGMSTKRSKKSGQDIVNCVTRLGNFLHFGQLLKACGNNYFAQIAHILGNFCKGVKIFHFSSEIIFGQLFTGHTNREPRRRVFRR